MCHRDYMTVKLLLPVPINKSIVNILTEHPSVMQNFNSLWHNDYGCYAVSVCVYINRSTTAVSQMDMSVQMNKLNGAQLKIDQGAALNIKCTDQLNSGQRRNSITKSSYVVSLDIKNWLAHNFLQLNSLAPNTIPLLLSRIWITFLPTWDHMPRTLVLYF